jgi:dTDP-4-dehydrorhamnose 3,5-epimerase
MIFTATPVDSAFVIDLERRADHRGFFARTLCVREFAAHGIAGEFVQGSVSHNHRRGTLRGMHFQWPPSRENKLVRCAAGAIYDVIIDLRPASATYLRHFGVELDARGQRGLYIPWGCAHGFLTLADAVEVSYLMTDYYQPELAAGVRWNDPRFGIAWPEPVTEMVERDASYPDFDASAHRRQFEASLAASEPSGRG